MKKGKGAAVMFAAAVLLTACGTKADSTVTTEEIVVPEMSSEDLLVNSLEYLLRDDGTEPEQDALTDEETEPEENKESVSLILYYRNSSCDGLTSRIEEAEELTAEVLVTALARHNIVSLDTKVISFEEEESADGKVLYLDLSGEMDDYLSTMTKEAKNIIQDSITNTFLENYNADIIYICIEGEPLEESEVTDKV